MELVEFAKNILLSEKIENKIFTPDKFSDNNRYYDLNKIPNEPSRSKKLMFSKKSARQTFPKQSELTTKENRGKALHFFANHELLAMELMALAILKFQDADPKFRMEIAKTITEEQKHFKLYTERAKELGIEFGEVPVNDFFWKSLSGMRTPGDYISHINLTFEQANLDYAAYYQSLFNKLGDKRSAKIMAIVLADEIGHVNSGVKWSLPVGGLDLTTDSSFHDFNKKLIPPVTPAWAKGKVFNTAARASSGLPVGFVEQLGQFNSSRGRPPRIYFVNGTSDFSDFKINDTKKLHSLGAFLGKNQDEFISESLSKEFTASLLSLGIKPNQRCSTNGSETIKRKIFSATTIDKLKDFSLPMNFDEKFKEYYLPKKDIRKPNYQFHIESFNGYNHTSISRHIYSKKGNLLAIDFTPDRRSSFCFYKLSNGKIRSLVDLKKLFFETENPSCDNFSQTLSLNNIDTDEDLSLDSATNLTLSGHLSIIRNIIHSKSHCIWFYIKQGHIEKFENEYTNWNEDKKILNGLIRTSDIKNDQDGSGYFLISEEEKIMNTISMLGDLYDY